MGRLVENAVLSESAILASPDAAMSDLGIYRSLLIRADVQGSSGFYPAEVLRRDGASAFPAGTHVYIDHPTRSEEEERPERSVLEMAGVLLDPAIFEEAPDGRGLFSRVQFFDDVKDMIKARWQHVGLSIRAAGEVEDTPTGRIVRRISEGLSVDVVTRPGAGGRLVTMTESVQTGSPPAEDKLEEGAIPATTGTGTLLNEVASMKAALSENLEQLNTQVVALGNVVKELQRSSIERGQEYTEVKEAVSFLKKRQEANDRTISESKTLGETLTEILKAGLPLPAMLRVAESWRPNDPQHNDLHKSIQSEREYTKKLRESDRGGDLGKTESSMLGLTESATTEFSLNNTSDEDFAEIDAVLGGKLY